MKRAITWMLGVAMALTSGFAFANAKVHSMTGSVSAAVGTAPARAVKVGETLPAGQTVVTAANSTVVLQFPDGQITALTPNSRMTIEQYQFNEQQKSGNMLLNLISGGMRAVTGLIGRTSPDKVTYRAATATIGIRGTDTTIAVAGGTVSVVVNGGSVTFTMVIAGVSQTVTVPASSGIVTTTQGQVVIRDGKPVTVSTITVQSTADVVAAINAVGGAAATAIANAISNANAATVQQAITNAATPNTSTVVTQTVATGTTTQTTTVETPVETPKPPSSP